MSETQADEQLELLRAVTRGKKPKPPDPLAESLPVARVAVDLPLPHLDRAFDYGVPQSMSADAQPGVRVRVRFAGQDVEGYLLERVAESDHQGRLNALRRVVSPEQVLSPLVLRLARAVADRYAGSLNDVLRLAVPPRHAKAEQAARPEPVALPVATVDPASGWEGYPAGAALVARLAAGDSPRAVWTALAGPSWTTALAGAIEATLGSGRGALVVLPDRRDVEILDGVLAARLGPGRHVRLEADLGPTARYRNWLAVLRGDVQVAIGTRAAAFAPVQRLGLVAIWDDGDDLHQEPRAPYPHAREVLALRAELEGTALIAGGWSQTVEGAAWIRSGWARPVQAERATLRAGWPAISVASTAFGADEDPSSFGRIPAPAWRAVRDGLQRGAVLVQVPRAGYLPGLSCQSCRKPARCTFCHGPLSFPGAGITGTRTGASTGVESGASTGTTGPSTGPGTGIPHRAPARPGGGGPHTPECRWCGRIATAWSCPHCQGQRLRATSVGVVRTAEELGRAFPGAVVVVPRSEQETPVVPDKALVVATPGLEPPIAGGYAAAVLLDGGRLLERPDLRASEDALRRWLAAAALVRTAPEGGKVVICADSQAPAVQALVRVDPARHAERELDERAELGFPPVVVMAELTGPAAAVGAILELARLPEGTQTLGPIAVDPHPGPGTGSGTGSGSVTEPGAGSGPRSGGRSGTRSGKGTPIDGPPAVRVLLRAEREDLRSLAAALHAAAALRSARRDPGSVRIQVDPPNPG